MKMMLKVENLTLQENVRKYYYVFFKCVFYSIAFFDIAQNLKWVFLKSIKAINLKFSGSAI